MHELSLSISLVAYLQDLATSQGLRRIDAIYLEVGELTHVEPRQLKEAFKIASQGTLAEKSRVYIRRKRLGLRCAKCGRETKFEPKETLVDYTFKCAHCGSSDVEIDKGRELLLRRVRGSK